MRFIYSPAAPLGRASLARTAEASSSMMSETRDQPDQGIRIDRLREMGLVSGRERPPPVFVLDMGREGGGREDPPAPVGRPAHGADQLVSVLARHADVGEQH